MRECQPKLAFGLAGLLHPAADPGVRCVSRQFPVLPTPSPAPALRWRSVVGHTEAVSSQRGSYPSEDSTPPQPRRVATTVASHEALLRGGVRTGDRRFQRPPGLSSLGSGPLRGASTTGSLPPTEASRTRCAGLPTARDSCSSAAAPADVLGGASLRSALASPSARADLAIGARLAGHGGGPCVRTLP